MRGWIFAALLTFLACQSTDVAVDSSLLVEAPVPPPKGTASPSPVPPAAPAISSVAPSCGATAGGTAITITGTNFGATSTATIGGAACTSPTVTSTQLTCTSPAHSAATVDVIVTSAGQTATKSSSYTYPCATPPPTVTLVTPNSGTVQGGTSVTLTGTEYVNGTTSVSIGGVACTGVAVTNSTTLTCTTGAHYFKGSVSVTVTVSATTSAPLASGYTYDGAPTLTMIRSNYLSPNCSGCHNGGGGSGGFDYTDHANLSAPSSGCGGTPRYSCTLTRISNGSMPPGGPTASSAHQTALSDWINAGAQDN